MPSRASRQPDPVNHPVRLGKSLQRASGRSASPPTQDRRRLSVRAAPELFGGAVGHGGLDASVPQRARAFAGAVNDTFRSRADRVSQSNLTHRNSIATAVT
jgi:hypothetical protein